MAPGQYRLVVNKSGRQTGSSPFSTLYYPGTADKDKATVVTIGEGEHLDNLDIRVPTLSRRVRVSGLMQFNDGTPIPGQWVNFVSADGNYQERAMTEKDGSFLFSLLAGAS